MPQNVFVADQLEDGVITDVKVAVGAGIQLSKLEKMPLAADGSVVATGDIDLGNNNIINLSPGTATGQAVEYDQMNAAIAASGAASEWFDSAINRLADPPASPNSGDRYLIIAPASGDWTGKEDQVATWDGSVWTYQIPTTGTYISVDAETDGFYYYGGSAWSKKYFENTTASNGITKVGSDIQLDPTVAGDGIDLTAGVLTVGLTSLGGLEFDGTSPDKTVGVKVETDGAIEIDAVTGGLQFKVNSTASGNLSPAISLDTDGAAIKIDNSSIVDDGSGNLQVGVIDITNMAHGTVAGSFFIWSGTSTIEVVDEKEQSTASAFSSQVSGGTYTLAHSPLGNVDFYYNGGLMNEGGASDDYSRSGDTITINRPISSAKAVEFRYVRAV